jgi:hypothetical protein
MLPLVLAFALQAPANESADEIMAKVAENQERAHEARSRFVYKQDIVGRLIRGSGGKLSREERREYTVTPEAKGQNKELTRFEGKYEKGGKLYPYDKPGFQYKDTDIDGDLLSDLIDDLVNEKNSKDGLETDVFPLRKDKLREYKFKLEEKRLLKGRQVYRISFKPQNKDDFGWAGEVMVDAEEYQPVTVHSKLSRGIPMAVKILLGTDIKQLGFSLDYQRVDDGVWFPVSYGTEFYIRAVFFYARTITMSMKNSDFRATDVQSQITYSDK